MRLRAATIADAAEIAAVHVRSYQAAHRGIVPDAALAALSVEDRAAQWRDRLADHAAEGRRIWASERDVSGAGLAGFAATAPSRDADAAELTQELLLIYVVPDCWGAGHGRALITHAADDVRARGAHAMTLWVFEANTRARQFYEQVGYTRDGAHKLVERGGATLRELRYHRQLR